MRENEEEHLNPTEEITLEVVKERAVKGVVVLTGRTFFLSVISLVATAFLTVFLNPSDFGIFWIVSAVVNFLSYFSDVGLAAALIQKKETPSKEDLHTTFTVQQILVVTVLVVLYLASPFLAKYYGLSHAGKLLLYALVELDRVIFFPLHQLRQKFLQMVKVCRNLIHHYPSINEQNESFVSDHS